MPSGEVSIHELFDNPQMEIEAISNLTIDDLIYAACRGGPSAVITDKHSAALKVAVSYVDSVCESDISRVDGVSHNPKRARQILRSYARNISTLAKTSALLQDVVTSQAPSETKEPHH